MTADFKDPVQVKEYLKNLHIEYKFGCYSEKKPEVCHLLGDFKESIKKEFDTAVKIYKRTCDEYNYGRSCTKYGDYTMIGKGCVKNVRVGLEYMKKGCQLDDENGCVHGGIFGASFRNGMPVYDKNSRPIKKTVEPSEANDKSAQQKNSAAEDANANMLVPPEKEQAKYVTDETPEQIKKRIHVGMEMLEKACDKWNSDKACFYLSSIYLAGIDGFVEKDLLKAYKISLKSCEVGNPYACANVSQMHKVGDGVEQNPDLAETFKKRADELMKENRNPSTVKFQIGT